MRRRIVAVRAKSKIFTEVPAIAAPFRKIKSVRAMLDIIICRLFLFIANLLRLGKIATFLTNKNLRVVKVVSGREAVSHPETFSLRLEAARRESAFEGWHERVGIVAFFDVEVFDIMVAIISNFQLPIL